MGRRGDHTDEVWGGGGDHTDEVQGGGVALGMFKVQTCDHVIGRRMMIRM